MEEMNQTVAEGAVTKKDLRRLFLRSWTIMCSWNYERQMHMGFMFGMAPILDKLYKNKPEKCREAYQRHMEFFNCTPQVTGFIMGLAASMEEQNAKCEDGSFQPESISMICGNWRQLFPGYSAYHNIWNWPVFCTARQCIRTDSGSSSLRNSLNYHGVLWNGSGLSVW